MLQGSILQQLATAHKSTKTPLNLGVYYKNTLVALCHALEDFILESESEPIVIAAFQQGKWYLQEAERYMAIAQKSAQIAILATLDAGFADHPTAKQDNVRLVDLKNEDPVAQEWHLMILSPKYSAMVLCQELSDADYGPKGTPDNDLERKFYGFWTFEPQLVREAVDLAIAHLQSYQPQLAEQLRQQVNQMTAEFGHCQRDDLNLVVSKVVDYLQKMHDDTANLTDTAFSEALEENLTSNEMQAFLRMAQLIEKVDVSNPTPTAEVALLCEAMGQLLDLPAWQLKRLKLAALLHRLDPLQRATPLSPLKTKTQQDILRQQGILPKASVLRVMPQLQAIANIINHLHEHWDGTGQPDGLAYDNIPLESRIIHLICTFQKQVFHYQQENHETPLVQATNDCETQSGKLFDPKLVETLNLLVMAMQQGMNFEVSQPKIASGLWLLEETSL